MNKDQEKYIFKLVKKEMKRLDILKYDYNPDYDSKELKKIFNEISLCLSILITSGRFVLPQLLQFVKIGLPLITKLIGI